MATQAQARHDGSATTPEPGPGLDVAAIREQFPPLTRELRPGVPLTYLDSAATSLKPRPVIDAVAAYDSEYPANVHRGLHALSERATEAYEESRVRVARFFGWTDPEGVVFTPGCTGSINMVAQAWGARHLKEDDRILLTLLEHHSNIVPWQMVAERAGASVDFVGLDPTGRLDLDDFRSRLTDRTRMVAVTGMSNVMGVIPPVAEMAKLAHEVGAKVLVDAAQSAPHLPVDRIAPGADFVAVSGHKLGGPTGVGVLLARAADLEDLPPAWGGGGMIATVSTQGTCYTEPPMRFEPGTPPIAQAIGVAAACDWLDALGRDRIRQHERAVIRHAHRALGSVPGMQIVSPAPAGDPDPDQEDDVGGLISFTVEGLHPHDLAQLADRAGVAIRAGHHCAMPLHTHLDLPATARASAFVYNTAEDFDRLAEAIREARRLFRLDA